MCLSRLHRVVATKEPGAVLVEDVDGSRHEVSLLALDGDVPEVGDWLVVNSGYAVERVDRAEAEEVAAEIRAANALDDSERGSVSPGMGAAGLTMLISGVSVFANSYGVRAVAQPALYTTAKNLVAALVLGAVALGVLGRRVRSRAGAAGVVDTPVAGGWRTWKTPRLLALSYVGIVGGGLAFVAFFDGLARTSATPAAFLKDSLVVWVALLAVPLLGERVTRWNVAAIAVLLVGQVIVLGGTGHVTLNAGDRLVLLATLLWSVEVVVAKRLLGQIDPFALGVTRMGVGSLVLVFYLAATGALGGLLHLDAHQLGWVVLTGGLLAGYVGTWFWALSRARAVDVTSILVGSALVTALLQASAGSTSVAPHAAGLVLMAGGVLLAVGAVPRRVRA